MNRREFVMTGSMATVTGLGLRADPVRESSGSIGAGDKENDPMPMSDGKHSRDFNGPYEGPFLDRIAFPLGGIGAGMVCMEGSGCISHVSVRNSPDIFNEPYMIAAISVNGDPETAHVLEGPVPRYKVFGRSQTGKGSKDSTYGFPRFDKATFDSRFPFAKVKLEDDKVPLDAEIQAWSPFIAGDEDNSSLPVAGLEYTFHNPTSKPMECVFSYHALNLMRFLKEGSTHEYEPGHHIRKFPNGFLLSQDCQEGRPHAKGEFGIFAEADKVIVDHCHFRGSWFDGRTVMWRDVASGNTPSRDVKEDATGASLYVPFTLGAGKSITIPLLFAWHVPYSNLREGWGNDAFQKAKADCESGNLDCCSREYTSHFYEPWYSGKFNDCREVASYWRENYKTLKKRTSRFTDAFYEQSLPPEVIEAVAANLTILKSPTVLRLRDGRLWCWEGCGDSSGCCHGSCTHVWNYAQAIPHLFPRLERSLRETEFIENQDAEGHQNFRAALPIRENSHEFHAAADGELGGIMKMHRDWRISGDTQWLKNLWPRLCVSMDYCIRTWDPKGKGILEEPHHNTYDIEFWGPDGMCTSFYLGALYAMMKMGDALGEDVSKFGNLYGKGRDYVETELFNGEFFIQKIQWKGLETPSPLEKLEENWNINYSEEALELLKKEGPKYQYGTGCLSDGVLGAWIGRVCGLEDFLDTEKTKSHLLSVHKHNLRKDLSEHVNPQRPAYAMGHEGGLLLCTWPNGGALTLPFVYSNEVWTGIEYQVASHLMLMGEVNAGLDIVREVRKRYDGRIRNPFNEFECGHWYARAMASYGMIQGLTGIRYDAVDRVLSFDSRIGNTFRSFLSTETGYALVGLQDGIPWMEVIEGEIPVEQCVVSGILVKTFHYKS